MSWGRSLVLLGAIACLAGCGSAEEGGGKVRGTTLTIYYSGPVHGASSAGSEAALDGATMALDAAHGRIGKYRIVLRTLDDSTPQSDGWDPNQTTIDARTAALDPTTIGYLGDFNSGAAAISIPILNRQGIPQLSAAASAVGLSSAGPGASPGEPEKYYPNGTRTFARPVPSDAVEAIVQVRLVQSDRCGRIFVLHDGEVDGEDEALSFVLTAESAGQHVIGVQEFPRQAPDYAPLALSVAQARPDCVLLSAIDQRSAARLTNQLAQVLPRALLVASSGLAGSGYTDPAEGGLSPAAGARVLITSPALPATSYPASGRAFLDAYARRFGPAEPPAIFGYESMSLLLGAIAKATDHGRKTAERSKVVQAIFATRHRHSVLGSYRLDPDGDTTLQSYGIYRVIGGRLTLQQVR